jgi:hypothetical protein
MDRETLDSLDKETLIRLILSQEAIERLTREVEALRADNACRGPAAGCSLHDCQQEVRFRHEGDHGVHDILCAGSARIWACGQHGKHEQRPRSARSR